MSRMLHRFQGEVGNRRLIEALLQQDTVANLPGAAERLACVGELVEFGSGSLLIEQGGGDDDVYFLLDGQTHVILNGQHVNSRHGGTVVGEMAAIDPTARRSATIKAANDVIALRVSATALCELGNDSLRFWKNLTRLVCRRLRERTRFHLPPNPTPIMFVGSSRESLPIAEAIRNGLARDAIDVRPWSAGGVFGASQTTIDALVAQVEIADFALLVFGPDDQIRSRNKDHVGPRDNVIFEMGLFLGRLGRARAFMLRAEGADLKIPSDLMGVIPLTYESASEQRDSASVTRACDEIRRRVAVLGVVADRMRL